MNGEVFLEIENSGESSIDVNYQLFVNQRCEPMNAMSLNDDATATVESGGAQIDLSSVSFAVGADLPCGLGENLSYLIIQLFHV